MVILAVMATGLFALDLGGIKGTWQDPKWDADWTFSADGHIVLSLSSTGEKIFDFKETERAYKFTKGVSLSTDLDMVINPDWTDEDYNVSIKLK